MVGTEQYLEMSKSSFMCRTGVVFGASDTKEGSLSNRTAL